MAKPLVVAFVSEVAGAIRDAKRLGDAVDDVAKGAENTEEAFKESEAALRGLGVKSEAVADKQIQKLRDRFDQVKNSGVASADEIARAQETMERKIKRINDEIGRDTTATWDRILAKVNTGIGGLRSAVGVGLRVGAVAAGAGVAAGAATFATVASSADRADQLRKAARRSNMDTEELSGLAFAAEQSAVGFDVLLRSLKNIDVNMRGKKAEVFKELGVSITDAAGNSRSASDVFKDTLEALRLMEDQGKATALAAEVLGAKAGPDMATLISIGKAGIEDYQKAAQKFGIVVSDEAGEAAERFNDRLDDLHKRFAGLKNQISTPFYDVFADVFEKMGGLIDENRDKVIEFGQMVSTKVLEVINDIIAVLEGRDNDVVNKWILDLIDLFGKLADGLVGATDFVMNLKQGIDALSEALKFVSVPLETVWELMNMVAGGLGTGFSKVMNIGELERIQRNAAAYAQSPEFAEFRRNQGKPQSVVNLTIENKDYPMTADADVAAALARNQSIKQGLRKTSPSRSS